MAKDYWLRFGTGDPATNTGLSPTFTIFSAGGLTALSAPGITETPTGSGLYRFQYGPTLSIVFTCDGGAALSGGDRYIVGALDPIQTLDQQVGTVDASFGSTASDPDTVMGYLKRSQEVSEGDAVFTKSTGAWQVYSRGSSTLLFEKSLSNNTTEASKS